MNHFLKIKNVPMWVGFNSLIYEDVAPAHKILYLTPINASPTSKDVVLQTLIQGFKIAEECNETYMQITYDLAIAKTAMQIQSAEHPRYHRIFVHLGAFHISLVFFKAVGKFISNRGLTNVMVHAEVIAEGSVNELISGTHFNCCKRLHVLVALALLNLHFELFREKNDIVITEEQKKIFQKFSTEKSMAPSITDKKLIHIFELYEIFRETTLKGEHSKTAQYYMMYDELIITLCYRTVYVLVIFTFSYLSSRI